jgi:hypothetical protein
VIDRIRQSSLDTWERCPEQFRRRYLEGEIVPPGIAARIGTGLHKGAEVNHRGKIRTGSDEPLDVVQDAARDGYVRSLGNGVFFPPEEVPSARVQLAEGVDVTTMLAGVYHTSLAPHIRPKLVEETVYMDVDAIPLPISGTIDVLTEDGWLPDLKTAAKAWPKGRADKSNQATIYNELVKSATGEYPDKISFEVFTKAKAEHHSYETARTPEDFSVVRMKIDLMLRMIGAGLFPPASSDSWMCSPRYCGYYYTCRYIPNHKKILPKRSK